ncbi:MAG: hypothetical protein Q8O03_07660 [Nanoarchaeota archaeon]|nr:hypothetical protein [Nanoarchaeota archaeon]
MKKSLMLIIFLFMPVVLAQTWTSQENFKCSICCVENDKFTLTTTITNNGSETLWIGKANLIGKDGEEFASYTQLDENFRYGLPPGKSINLGYSGTWPKPSIKNILDYKQCLYLGTLSKLFCEENYKEKTLASRTRFQCYEDIDCPDDEVCEVSNDCTSSVCKVIPISEECGRIVSGDWRPYECCEDKECKEGQYCLDNNCELLDCEDCEYVYEHKCVKFECCDNIDCEKNEVCEDNKCSELECGYCEYADKHNCNRYTCCKDAECAGDETCKDNQCQNVVCEKGYVENHKCVLYQCSNNEECKADSKCESNFCKSLACKENDVISNHECQQAGFKLFGYVKEHAYVSYFSKEAYKDNKEIYNAIFVILSVLILRISYLTIRAFLRERKRRRSYIVIRAKP